MQAIQVFTALDDAWGGFAAQYLDRIRDDYPKTTLWVWGSQAAPQGQLQRVNLSQSIATICKQASMLVPISLPVGLLPSNTCLTRDSLWESSALMSTALETAGLVSRLRQAEVRHSLGDIIARINTNGSQTIGRLRMTSSELKKYRNDVSQQLHPPHGSFDSALDVVELFNLPKKQGRTQSTKTPTCVFGQSITSRTSGQLFGNIHNGHDSLSTHWAPGEKIYR